jgi:PTH1 family peptidyl-tRNA hydrolase
MLIFAGLGNPGRDYAANRHNLGAMAVDAIARRWTFDRERSRFSSLAREGAIDTPAGGVRVLILKPQTYYNDSGKAVGDAVKFYKLAPTDVVVFYDEIDLAPGRFRMKTGGGAAGNNGIRSITARIGPDFRRARLGTGHPGHKGLVMGHVLSDFHKVDAPWVRQLVGACAEAAPLLVAGEDERYQAEVMRLAPAVKLDPRAAARGNGDALNGDEGA